MNIQRAIKIIFFFTTLIYTSCAAAATHSPAGLWLASSPFFDGKNIAIIKLYFTHKKLCGEIVKVMPLNGSFATRTRIASSGPVMMCDFHKEDGKWIGGKIYEQTTASLYDGEIEMNAEGNLLRVHGHWGPASRSAVWRRVR